MARAGHPEKSHPVLTTLNSFSLPVSRGHGSLLVSVIGNVDIHNEKKSKIHTFFNSGLSTPGTGRSLVGPTPNLGTEDSVSGSHREEGPFHRL